MAFADNGGFDIVIELPLGAVTTLATSLVTLTSLTGPITSPGVTGSMFITPSLTGVSFIAPTSFVNFAINLAGSSLTITAVTMTLPTGPFTLTIPPMMRSISLGTSTAVLLDRLEVAGLNIVIDFTSAPAGGSDATATLDTTTILASPASMFILSFAALDGPEALAAARAVLLTGIASAVENSMRAVAAGLGVVTLVTPPAGLPVLVSNTRFGTGTGSFNLLYTLGGAPGAPDSITRSNLRLGGALPGGAPPDVLALIFSNAVMLRDFLRPPATLTLALAASGFAAAHPFAWSGTAPMTPAGGLPPGVASVDVTSVIGGIDGVNMKLVATLVATGVSGTFTLDAKVTFTLPLAVMVAGTSIIISVGPVPPPVVVSAVDIPLWVYAAGTLAYGPLLTGVLAAIDLFGGSLANGPIMTALIGTVPARSMTMPMPAGFPAIALRGVSLMQSDSLMRTVPAPRDPYLAHDIIINFV